MIKTIIYGMFCYGKVWKGTHHWELFKRGSDYELDEYRCTKCKRKRGYV